MVLVQLELRIKNSMKVLKIFLVLLVLSTINAFANSNDKILEKINNYLFNINTFEANFLQFSDTGDSSEGKFYIKRPDKLKFEYVDPFKSILVTNGKTTKYYDVEMDELTTIPTKKTPLLFLLKKEDDIKKLGFNVDSIEKKSGKVYINTTNKDIKELNDKKVSFIFDMKTIDLVGINIEDEMKNKLYIEFSNIKLNQDLEDDVFNFNLKNKNRKGKF